MIRFTEISNTVLHLQIWIQIPFRRVDTTDPNTRKVVPEVEVVVEKKSMVNLVSNYMRIDKQHF